MVTSVIQDRPAVGDEDLPGAWPGQREGLSVREAEMISLIAGGMTNQDIAASNDLSINTVKTYIRSAYRKIGHHPAARVPCGHGRTQSISLVGCCCGRVSR